VEVLNVLGAGDAFLSGFLKGWLRGEDMRRCRYANGCGALVVSRHGCAPAMPSPVELDYFLANAAKLTQPDQDATLAACTARRWRARSGMSCACCVRSPHAILELAQQRARRSAISALKH
jgi:5-dehydro-2-deoxygluconokinase